MGQTVASRLTQSGIGSEAREWVDGCTVTHVFLRRKSLPDARFAGKPVQQWRAVVFPVGFPLG